MRRGSSTGPLRSPGRVLLGALVVLAPAVLAGDASVPGVRAEGAGQPLEPLVCEQNGGHVAVVRDPRPRWDPGCVEILSGEAVTWTNTDLAPHDPGSSRDGGACFRAGADAGSAVPPGGTYRRVFRLALLGVQVSADGATWEDCPLAADPLRSTLDVATVPYRCFEPGHAMKGFLVVRRDPLGS